MTENSELVAVTHNPFNTDDLRIVEIKEVLPPIQVHEEFPITENAADTVVRARRSIQALLGGQDDRLLVIIGPCSIHDPKAALEYGQRLLALKTELEQDLLIVMRVYFEKPRTTVGWKGLINDPDLDESFNINKGLRLARGLLRDLNDMGVPAGTEYLDQFTPQYVSDLIAWGAIGARTTESQVHRELASGLSCPVGFKNGTDGGVQVAIDATRAARRPHHFLSLTKAGHSAIFATTGNEHSHIILRGGKKSPNYDAASIDAAAKALTEAGLPAKLMVDFSHANSSKDYRRQTLVARDVAEQIIAGEDRIFGVMIESHLVAGNQKLVSSGSLTYGQSVTDACIDWDESVKVLRELASAVATRRVGSRAKRAVGE